MDSRGISFGYYRIGPTGDRAARLRGAIIGAAIEDTIYDAPAGEAVVEAVVDPFTPGQPAPRRSIVAAARIQGYTGNTCTQCGSVRMRVSGHCEVCEDCGSSSGCS